MSTVQAYRQKTEPLWFSRVREAFGDLIYDRSVEMLGIDALRRYSLRYNPENSMVEKIILDYYQRSFVKFR